MKPRILITIGDINGIGPEIILKTIKDKNLSSGFDITIVGPEEALQYYCRLYKFKLPEIKIINPFQLKTARTGKTKKFKVEPGRITKRAGSISGGAIETAVLLCLKGEYDAIVTAPISKKALNLGGYNFDGHTEMLTELSNAKNTAMIMLHRKINIGFATTHPPLKDAAGLITKKLLYNKIKTCYNFLKNGIDKPNISIGVLGLNPHAGDSGLIGDEEIKIISPVIKKLNKELYCQKLTNKYLKLEGCVKGPFPSDSYFANETYRKFSLTFAMYHDQGFIPFKMIAGKFGVNFTAGLPFVRTSPDHGTAFDIAGKGMADEISLIEAITTADLICRERMKKV